MIDIEVKGGEYVIRCDYEHLNWVRSLPSRRWDGRTATWKAPETIENYDALRLIVDVDALGLVRPEKTGYVIDATEKKLLKITVPPSPANIERCRQIPDYRMWSEEQRAWLCRLTQANLKYLLTVFPQAQWTEAAGTLVAPLHIKVGEAEVLRQQKMAAKDGILKTDVSDFKFKTPPFKHQEAAFALSRDQEEFALFMQQGTGKTKVEIDGAAYLAAQGKIEGHLIVCPKSVKSTWAEEYDTHCPDWMKRRVLIWNPSGGRAYQAELETFLSTPRVGMIGVLHVFIMNVDAFSTEKGRDVAERFLKSRRCKMTVDESSRIKSPNAKRTRGMVKLGKHAKYRRILSGVPITQGPLDTFAPFKFLNPNILGFSSFYAFRNHFAIMGGYGMRQVVSYTNLDELQRLIDPYTYRVLRSECLDLPPKIYQKISVDLTPEQREAYRKMKDGMALELAGQEISVTMVLTQMLRLQQIVGGFLPIQVEDSDGAKFSKPEPIPGGNAKLDALHDYLEDLDGKAIIWSRFRAEIGIIADSLRDRYGDESVVEFHGGVSDDERTRARRLFQDVHSPVRFFVGQTETGGIGLTLTAASTVIYFSNSFSLESRLQSEDRAHRIGQTKSVVYVDLVAPGTLDTKLLATLRNKQSLANLITGDAWQEWI